MNMVSFTQILCLIAIPPFFTGGCAAIDEVDLGDLPPFTATTQCAESVDELEGLPASAIRSVVKVHLLEKTKDRKEGEPVHRTTSTSTGFFVNKEGYVVTALHSAMVFDEDDMDGNPHTGIKLAGLHAVRTHDGQLYVAELVYPQVAYQFKHEVAVLKITYPEVPEDISVATFGREGVEKLDMLYSVPAPQPLRPCTHELSAGRVLSTKYEWTEQSSGHEKAYIGIENSSYRLGYSGSPAFNVRGEVVGMGEWCFVPRKTSTNCYFSYTKGIEGGFLTPVSVVVNELQKKGIVFHQAP